MKWIDFRSSGVESKNPSCLDVFVVGDILGLFKEEISSGHQCLVAWLQKMLEHVLDLIALLSSLRELDEKDGVTVVTVQNECLIVQQALLDNGPIENVLGDSG